MGLSSALCVLWALLSTCGISMLHASNPALHFSHLNVEDGLSNSSVHTVLQDRWGFLWIGTEDGLNRFDGNEMRVYKYDPGDADSLSDSYVHALFEDKDGQLWIGTFGGGLCRYEPQTDSFVRFQFDPDDPNSLSNNYVTHIAADREGNLWIGTMGGGISLLMRGGESFLNIRYEKQKDRGLFSNEIWTLLFDRRGHLWVGTYDGIGLLPHASLAKVRAGNAHFHQFGEGPGLLSDKRVRALLEDRDGVIWVGTFEGGLNRVAFRVEDQTAPVLDIRAYRKSDRVFSIQHEDVRALLQDRDGNIWVGTDGGGLHLFHTGRERFYHYRYHRENPTSIGSNRILSLYQDASDLIWIGTSAGGISRLDLKKSQFKHWRQGREGSPGLSDDFVKAVYQDSKGYLWVGTTQGLNRIPVGGDPVSSVDLETSELVVYKHRPGGDKGLGHNFVRAIVEDKDGYLWAGTWGGGLTRIETESGQTLWFKSQATDASTLSNNFVRSLFVDFEDNLWVGTSNGLNRYDSVDERFTRYRFDEADLANFGSNRISSMYQDRRGTLWLGSDGGLILFDPQSGRHHTYRHDPHDPTSLSNNRVRAVASLGNEVLWVGTAGGGLNRLDLENGTYRHFSEHDGLPNDIVCGLLFQGADYLWISTNQGLSRFDILNESFTNFTTKEGLHHNEYNTGAFFKNHLGEMFYGGVEGLTFFHPGRLKLNTHVPNVAITKFLLGGKPLSVPLHPSERRELVLPHSRNAFTFEFAVLDFTDPEKNKYAFKMEGFEEEWNYQGSIRRINYTNIDPGTYVFRVKGANNNGVWNEVGTSWSLVIVPPWWRTRLAFFLYFILMGTALFGLFHLYNLRRERSHRQALELAARDLEREHGVAERLRHVDRLKDEFLANTSHELRTPLNGIMGIVESLIDGVTGELPPKTVANLSMVLGSAKRLSNLVNDILDYSKLKERTIELDLKPVDMHSLVDVVLLLSKPMAQKKGLRLINAIEVDLVPVAGDENRLQQILHNLVGNAIKFTDRGCVTVSAQVSGAWLLVSVADTGIGIPSDRQRGIFSSFEQVHGSMERLHGGTGLGLAITKQLVELHKGRIWVESEAGKGATFRFTVPLSKEKKVEMEEIEAQLADLKHLQAGDHEGEVIAEYTRTGVQLEKAEDDYTILIVDDEPVNLQVLVNLLSLNQYRIVQASSGEQALAVVNQKNVPVDLVILDVMMPKMSGYQVCRELRHQYDHHELPVILLTARGQVDDMAIGFEAGANDFITKPVTKEELIPRIQTQLRFHDFRRDLASARQAVEAGAFAEENAKFATSILHNIGNVLNSLKVSAQQTLHKLEYSKVHRLEQAGNMLKEHEHDWARWMAEDPKGKLLPAYFMKIGSILSQENAFLSKQLEDMNKKTDLMQDIIEMQQRHAKQSTEKSDRFDLVALVFECCRIMEESFKRRNIDVRIPFDREWSVMVEAQRIHSIQIIMNVLKNAVEAMEETPEDRRRLELELITAPETNPVLTIRDHGVGISEQGLKRVFSHGYTTKRTGHGFGLHYCLDVMRQMGGDISVESEGEGKGALFRLEFAGSGSERAHSVPVSDSVGENE
ncbi:two-component regulator propeller domain-containing protein [Sulfidibacter corallicola]|uniref:histidine kinase n=1 Tax=Sulfidibacter corallicola TaxID=2818388 RepID=A0A8A4TTV5_SULCO|nr:two-component regulator propeller domain-containing protein [Sulfidibacter corallicola]QTD49965.1 response regulator [Sulfidibacter corallicola]